MYVIVLITLSIYRHVLKYFSINISIKYVVDVTALNSSQVLRVTSVWDKGGDLSVYRVQTVATAYVTNTQV